MFQSERVLDIFTMVISGLKTQFYTYEKENMVGIIELFHSV